MKTLKRYLIVIALAGAAMAETRLKIPYGEYRLKETYPTAPLVSATGSGKLISLACTVIEAPLNHGRMSFGLSIEIDGFTSDTVWVYSGFVHNGRVNFENNLINFARGYDKGQRQGDNFILQLDLPYQVLTVRPVWLGVGATAGMIRCSASYTN